MDQSLNTQPLVSIIMTSYNRAEFIGEAIESVLHQTYNNWELIILDDASTDKTSTVVAEFATRDARIIYFPTSTNLGITKNRNRGLTSAKGKYIAVLDSDDIWVDSNKLEKQVSFLETNTDHALVGTMVKVIDQSGNEISNFEYQSKDTDIRNQILLRNQFTHSAVLFNKHFLDEVGHYDEALAIWEDYDLILRLGRKYKFANLPETMTAYRKHSTNISKTTQQNGAKIHLKIIKQYKAIYPNYFLALLKGWFRLFV